MNPPMLRKKQKLIAKASKKRIWIKKKRFQILKRMKIVKQAIEIYDNHLIRYSLKLKHTVLPTKTNNININPIEKKLL